MTLALLGFQSTAVAIWAMITLLLGLVWLKRHLDINRAHRDRVLSPADAAGDDRELPSLAVLVAAKDEEANIGRCAEGLLRQQYPKLEIIMTNDRSTDRTGAILDGFAARDPRFKALHVRQLPAGWFGKNNAMREGVAASTGEYLCFSDADCAFDSDVLLKAAVRFALQEKTDLLSVLPVLEVGSFWERIVQPVAGGILVYWTPPHKVNDPRSACAYANGAFMLMPRRAYEAVGAHEAVKAYLNEDMYFARLIKQKGLRLRVIRSEAMYRVRMYVGFKQIWRGWTRIFYGCFGTLPKLLATLLVIAIASLSPYLTLALSPLVGVDAGRLAAAAGITILAQQTVLWRYYPVSGNPAIYALTYPLGALVSLGVAANAITRWAGRTTQWRGTTYARGG